MGKYEDQIGDQGRRETMVAAKRIHFCIVAISLSSIAVSFCPAQPCTPPPPDLIAWWSGDSDGTDITGNSYDALLNNGAVAGVPGWVGGAFQFDGLDDIADTSLTLAAKGTIDFWVNPG
jgi:hypothetical protein